MQLRNPKEVTTEDYNEFYKKTFNEYLDPLASSHFTTEVLTTMTHYVPPSNFACVSDLISAFEYIQPKFPIHVSFYIVFLLPKSCIMTIVGLSA